MTQPNILKTAIRLVKFPGILTLALCTNLNKIAVVKRYEGFTSLVQTIDKHSRVCLAGVPLFLN